MLFNFFKEGLKVCSRLLYYTNHMSSIEITEVNSEVFQQINWFSSASRCSSHFSKNFMQLLFSLSKAIPTNRSKVCRSILSLKQTSMAVKVLNCAVQLDISVKTVIISVIISASSNEVFSSKPQRTNFTDCNS